MQTKANDQIAGTQDLLDWHSLGENSGRQDQ